MEPMFTIRPQPRCRMPGNVALAVLKQPPRFTSITSFQASNVIFSSVPSRVIPALFTTTSIGPSSASMAATPSSTAWWSATLNFQARMPVRSVKAFALSSDPT